MEDPAVIEVSPQRIRREIFTVAGAPADATLPAAVGSQVVRYRLDASPPKPARAVLLFLPGFLEGAGAADAFARAVVRRSTADAALEVWALDRRSNLVEDHRGLDAAIAQRNANLATSYYFEHAALEGKTFDGFLTAAQASAMADWGLPTMVADVRAVVERFPAEARRARVFLAGHSLGGQFAAEYAAWDQGGKALGEELAGLLMLDAVTGGEGQSDAVTQAQYEVDGVPDPDLGTQPGLKDIHDGTPFITLPLLETRLYPVGAIAALRARLDPDGFDPDAQRSQALQLLFSTDKLPRITNEAALGLAFDDQSCPLVDARVSLGQATGGPLEEVASPLGGTVRRPSDPSATYRWLRFDQVTPKEHTAMADFTIAWTRPTVDFGEWYFPTRLGLDGAAAASLILDPSSWQTTKYGLRASHGRQLELPMLVEATSLSGGTAAGYDHLKALAAPLGDGRPFAGKTRAEPEAFRAVAHPELTHLDPLDGADLPGTVTGTWYDTVAGFLLDHSPAGSVSVAAQ